jgi:hypothetical protein
LPLLWGFFGRNSLGKGLGKGDDDAPILPGNLVQRPYADLKFGYQEVRTVVWLVVVCTRLVVGRRVEQDEDSPALPFYEECATAYAAAPGLGADPQYLGPDRRQARPVEAGSAVFIAGNVVHSCENTGASDLRFAYVFSANSFEGVEYVFDE